MLVHVVTFCLLTPDFLASTPGGVLPEKLGRGVLPKTLTLFMTKICNFPYPIYDLTKNLIPYL